MNANGAAPAMEPRHAPPKAACIAVLAGRPNSGKTSLLMHLTGTSQRPVNFPGTSVERAEGSVQVGDVRLRAVDLPGIGSLAPLTRDEELAIGYLRGETKAAPDTGAAERPDVLCAVLDASKPSVELHLLRELSTLGLPLVVALNKQDVARRQGRPVDAAVLAGVLGVPVVETNAHSGAGVDALRRTLLSVAGNAPPAPLQFDPEALAARVAAKAAPDRTWTNRLDAVLLHRWLGLPILGFVVLGMFQLVFSGAAPFMDWIEAGQELLEGLIEGAVPAGALQSFLVDGIVNGVGSIVVFLPQIVLLVALVTALEASGYMARAAFLLDRVLGKVGLSGRSFVPLASSFACAIPGILASRIIDNERDRLATIVVSPLMSCSARLPVYVVLIGAFFPAAWAGVALFGMYLVGIVTAAVVAFVLRRTILRGGRSLLLMELPVYHRPSLRVVAGQVGAACREFLVMAGTVIFATAIVVWALGYYPRPAHVHARFDAERATVEAQLAAEAATTEERAARRRVIDDAEAAAYREQSLLARGGKAIQPLFAPAGFDWRITVGILSAFPARELVVPTLGVLYSLGEVDPGAYDLASLRAAADGQPDGLREKLRAAKGADGKPVFDWLVALAVMVFFALCSQCAATLGAIRRETRSWRWPLFTFAYMTVLAWGAAVAVYQVGRGLGLGGA